MLNPKTAGVFLDTIPFIRGVPVMAPADIEEITGQELQRAFMASCLWRSLAGSQQSHPDILR
jgi:hypothetical protein